MNRSRCRAPTGRLAGMIAVTALIALSGCSSDDNQPEATIDSFDTSAPVTQTEGPPPDEGGGGGGASVSLPSAPVGGQSEPPGDDPAFQCLSVNWLAGDDATIPAGATVTLGDFSFDPAVLDVVDSGCEGFGPHCSGFAFTASESSCSLPLHWNGTPFDPEIQVASASVGAEAVCADESSECLAFLEAVTNQAGSQLQVILPFIEPTTEESTSDGTETTES